MLAIMELIFDIIDEHKHLKIVYSRSFCQTINHTSVCSHNALSILWPMSEGVLRCTQLRIITLLSNNYSHILLSNSHTFHATNWRILEMISSQNADSNESKHDIKLYLNQG